jgi:primosomal protein N' (replication factor Y)
MSRLTLFVDVILPLPVPNLYTYRVPMDWNEQVKPGQRVIVQFGKNKLYTALIRRIHERAPASYTAKYIDSVLDEYPVVNEQQFLLWEQLAAYYMCQLGDVLNAALPAGLKLSSETKIVLNTAYTGNRLELTEREFIVVEALDVRNVLTFQEVSEILSLKIIQPVLKSLLDKGLVLVREEVRERYKPKIETYLALSEEAEKEDELKIIFDKLEKKAPKQLEALIAYIKFSQRYAAERKAVRKADIVKNSDLAAVTSLIKKGIFIPFDEEVGRIRHEHGGRMTEKPLNPDQVIAVEKLQEDFKTKDIALIHGVTSSGKTEIYLKLIKETLAAGKQVLYLLPEIALTTQIITRLQNHFGGSISIYHSRFNENERVEIWKTILGIMDAGSKSVSEGLPDNQNNLAANLVLGARSAVFLPFTNLGLIIVDEEHDSSYKQYDPAPRYNARETAMFLAHIHGAKVLLGSATPSVESTFNALSGKYGFAELTSRFGGMEMPEIEVVDIKEASKRKLMKSHFSPQLLTKMEEVLANKEQIILFQNRRGFSPMMECATCAWTPRCTQCDVSLTYHKLVNQMRCHYCGYSIKPPASCPACGDTNMRTKGFGTEKIEDELGIYFPSAKIARMDLDTTRAKFAHRQIISDFEERNIDILVGTQMVTKGLDFDHVALVGILNADSMLNFPDFRAFERSYQLMAQVAGRAGRKNKRGKVIIQSFNPEHPILNYVVTNNYSGMYISELNERKSFQYPPYYRLIQFTLRHRDKDILDIGANYFADILKKHFGKRVLGPEFPLVARIRNEYHKNILLKFEREASMSKVKEILLAEIAQFKNNVDFKGVKVVPDVDPI